MEALATLVGALASIVVALFLYFLQQGKIFIVFIIRVGNPHPDNSR